MKRYIILFWHGLTGILSSIAEWFTVVLGMKDDSKYGKVIRRTVGTCFATIMLLITAAVVWDFGRTACNRLNWSRSDYIPSYNNQYLSRNLSYHEGYDYDGYVFNRDGEKVIKKIHWIASRLEKIRLSAIVRERNVDTSICIPAKSLLNPSILMHGSSQMDWQRLKKTGGSSLLMLLGKL